MFDFFGSVNLNRIFYNLLEQAGGTFDFAVHKSLSLYI